MRTWQRLVRAVCTHFHVEGEDRMRVRTLVLAVVTVAAVGVVAAVGAQEKIKVRFGILTTGSQAAFYVGTKQGIFAKHGFDVEVKSLATGVQANQALAANQVDWSGGGVEPTVIAWSNDLSFKAYSMYAKGGDSYAILVRKDAKVEKIADLAGKRVAVPPGTAPAQGLSQLLISAGLKPDAAKRVNATYGAMGRMLIQGQVEAMAGLEPFVTLTMEQMKGEATILTRMGKHVQGGGFFLISNAWAQANPKKVQAAVAALWEAQQYVRKHPKEAAAVQAEFLKVEPRLVESAFKYLEFNPLLDPFTMESLAKTTEFLATEGLLKRKVDVAAELADAQAMIAELRKTKASLLE